jgi:hypothetical protein
MKKKQLKHQGYLEYKQKIKEGKKAENDFYCNFLKCNTKRCNDNIQERCLKKTFKENLSPKIIKETSETPDEGLTRSRTIHVFYYCKADCGHIEKFRKYIKTETIKEIEIAKRNDDSYFLIFTTNKRKYKLSEIEVLGAFDRLYRQRGLLRLTKIEKNDFYKKEK